MNHSNGSILAAEPTSLAGPWPSSEEREGCQLWESARAVGDCLKKLDELDVDSRIKAPLEKVLDDLVTEWVKGFVPISPRAADFPPPTMQEFRPFFREKLHALSDIIAELEQQCASVDLAPATV